MLAGKIPWWAVVIASLVLCCSLCCICCCLSGRSWRKKKVTNWESDSASKIAQTALGPVEYSIKGNAPYFLIFNGTPGLHGGYIGIMHEVLEYGFGVIAPSRPGYGRTPGKEERTTSDCADVFAALLDTLGVDQVIACTFSGGGPTGLRFAIRHPNRVKALIVECSITG